MRPEMMRLVCLLVHGIGVVLSQFHQLENNLSETEALLNELNKYISSQNYPVVAPKHHLHSIPTNSNHHGISIVKMTNETVLREQKERIPRQTVAQKLGLFGTLFKVTSEGISDTKSAIKEISEILSQGIAPDKSIMSKSALSKSSKLLDSQKMNDTGTDKMAGSTTEEPYVLTRSQLLDLIGRNLKGLVRLFNIEWQDALNVKIIDLSV